ncbi:MAG: quinol:electron acceptor oxidoreductase subunit ActD [Holophagaceae bacterium]
MAKNSSRIFRALQELLRSSRSRRTAGMAERPELLRSDFADPEELLKAVRKLRSLGVPVLETYTPFPIHGMDEALSERPSRLPWVTGLLGLLGCSGAVALQVWTSVVDYPLVIGGKPLASIPAFLPVMFESTVLIAGLGTVATLFALTKLRPRLTIPDLHLGANDDRFILVAAMGHGHTFDSLTALLAQHGAIETVRLLKDSRGVDASARWEREVPLPLALGAILAPAALILGLGSALNRDFHRRALEFDAGMMVPVAAQAYDPSAVLRGGQVLHAPPAGTVSRNQAPALRFGPGVEEAARAGLELKNPLEPTPANSARGQVIWTRICATCHGEGGKGDGGVIPRFPNPPNLMIPKYEAYTEGRIFHVATFGGPEKIMKPLGDHLSAEDRWRAAMHLKGLINEAAKARAKAAASTPAPAAAAPAQAPASAPTPGAKS